MELAISSPQRIYELLEVVAPIGIPGRLRQATDKDLDLDLVKTRSLAFLVDTNLGDSPEDGQQIELALRGATKRVADGSIFI